jgi:hypothetical protein
VTVSQPKSFDEELETPETEVETEAAPQPEPVQKQKPNIYTVMLILSFLFIAMSSLLLYMEGRQWGSFPWWKPGASGTSYLLEQELPSTPASILKSDVPPQMWA